MKRDVFFSARWVVATMVLLFAWPAPSAAQRRNRDANDNGDGGSQAVPRNQSPPPAPAPAPAPARPPAPAPAPSSGEASPRRTPRVVEPSASEPAPQTPGARPREGRRVTGTAVPRGSVPSPRPGTVIVPVYRGYWPWGYSGLGFGSYYGRYHDPYVFYDPYGPWYGYSGYGGYQYPAYRFADGALRLKVKPRDAQVYVDGYYVGVVDEFDGVFQRLNLETGPHRIEIRAPGFETLTFDVQIRWDDTTTFEGELRRIP